YQITDVSTTANWQSGWWNSDNGAFGDWTGIGNRAAMKKKVQVEYGTEYTLNLKNATGGLKYVLREYDSNGSFLKSFGTVELGATYTPSSESVGFVSLTVYDTANSQDPYTLISSGTIVPSMTIISSETSKNFVFSDTYADLSDNTADFKFDTSMAYPCVHSEWNKDLTAGTGVTITTKETVEPGIYDVTLFTRDASPRALIDISINGVVVAQSLDTTSSSIIANNSYKLKTISIPASTVLTIKVTVAESGKNVYLNSLTLTKTADYTTELTSAVATEASASIRLNEQNGIRFYTTVDEEALEALTSGVDYEIGTIVAPANALGSYGELTHEIGDANYAEIKYEVRTADGKIEYFNAENKEIVGSLVNIKDSNISREFMARAYVKVGETYYYSTTTSTRSLQTVATALQNDSSDTAQTLYQNHKAMVDAWAAGKAYN
ncbi:MAG: hypothetical protein ACI39F_07440, partial [Acutalibacteraceae bacterium]